MVGREDSYHDVQFSLLGFLSGLDKLHEVIDESLGIILGGQLDRGHLEGSSVDRLIAQVFSERRGSSSFAASRDTRD